MMNFQLKNNPQSGDNYISVQFWIPSASSIPAEWYATRSCLWWKWAACSPLPYGSRRSWAKAKLRLDSLAQWLCGLWFTVLFANFSEALAEGRGKAQAEALRKTRQTTQAKKLATPDRDDKI